MKSIKTMRFGFTTVEVLLALILVAIIAFSGIYVVHNQNSKTTVNTTQTPTTESSGQSTPHTAQQATTLVQTTYDNFLSAVNKANGSASNTQPLGIVGLAAVKDSMTSDFYAKAAASHNGSSFSCAAQFVPSKYTAGSATASTSSAVIPVTIANNSDGSITTTGMTVNVDLNALKITSVTCPS